MFQALSRTENKIPSSLCVTVTTIYRLFSGGGHVPRVTLELFVAFLPLNLRLLAILPLVAERDWKSCLQAEFVEVN